VASAVTDSALEPRRVLRGLAALLPPDVSVGAVREAAPGFDARRDARSRRYEYRVLPGPPSALRRGRVLHHPAPLDRAALERAARRAAGRHDFRAFTPTRTEHVFFERTVSVCEWRARGDELVLTVEADAFLRHMVRVMVGTFLLVGRGAWPASRLDALLAGAPRGAAGPTAPPHGLALVGVAYDPPL
jgi:tRNA pseudouridine38-40 synthase